MLFRSNFLGLSSPVVIAAVATVHFGLHRTALAYCVAIAALVAVAAGSLMLRWRGPAAAPTTASRRRIQPTATSGRRNGQHRRA